MIQQLQALILVLSFFGVALATFLLKIGEKIT
jgi:hypothetical protein